MRVWQSYGSEHSMDLVLIGTFQSLTDAEAAVERMELLRELAERVWEDDDWERPSERMPDTLREALAELGLWEMGRPDVDIYAYEHSVERDGEKVRIWTEETEPQGFIKVLIHLGARVEVFSRHHWLEDGTPRSTQSD
jgi:hypothetical protein